MREHDQITLYFTEKHLTACEEVVSTISTTTITSQVDITRIAANPFSHEERYGVPGKPRSCAHLLAKIINHTFCTWKATHIDSSED